MRVIDWLRKHAESEAGIAPALTLDEVRAHVAERLSEHFAALRRARVAMGFIRYEATRGRAPDYARRARVVLDRYDRTGNLECLVDLANYAEFEFQNPSHPHAHFTPEDGPGSEP